MELLGRETPALNQREWDREGCFLRRQEIEGSGTHSKVVPDLPSKFSAPSGTCHFLQVGHKAGQGRAVML